MVPGVWPRLWPTRRPPGAGMLWPSASGMASGGGRVRYAMIARGRGVILFTGATSAIRGRKGALDFSSAKFGLRGFADALARELWPQGIHVAHIVIDGEIGEPGAGDQPGDPKLDPDSIAASYWMLAGQELSAWTFELEVRPSREDFFV